MRLPVVALLVLLSVPAFAADTYRFDPNHTSVWWHANHFGFSTPSGRFGIKDGTVTLDEKEPKNSKLDVTIDIASLNTGIVKFDEHLSTKDFLDVAKYPQATFKSTSVKTTGSDTAKVTGDLTLHGVTKSVTLDVKLNKLDLQPMTKKKTAGFTATTMIKRSDFGIDQYVPNISDEVKLDIEAEAGIEEAKK